MVNKIIIGFNGLLKADPDSIRYQYKVKNLK